MIIREQEIRKQSIEQVAYRMMTAARTAPKARGIDNLELAVIIDEKVLEEIAQTMEKIGNETGKGFFLRDAIGIRQCGALVLFGSRSEAPFMGLDCGYCGWSTCKEKPSVAPCFFHAHDLGLAIGSAASVAADCRVDSRVMFSAGCAAHEIGIMSECKALLAMPLAVMGKSPYFDRANITVDKTVK